MKFDSLHFCSLDPNEDPKRRMALYRRRKKLRKELLKLETYVIKDIPTLTRDVLVGHPRKEKNNKKRG